LLECGDRVDKRELFRSTLALDDEMPHLAAASSGNIPRHGAPQEKAGAMPPVRLVAY